MVKGIYVPTARLSGRGPSLKPISEAVTRGPSISSDFWRTFGRLWSSGSDVGDASRGAASLGRYLGNIDLF